MTKRDIFAHGATARADADLKGMHQSHAHRNQFRRLNIAAGIVRGKSLAAIAREEGASRQTIPKQAASIEVQQIV